MAGKAAGVEGFAVPSHPGDVNFDTAPDEAINSDLLILQPENCDHPPFEDCKSLLLLPNYSNVVPSPFISLISIGLELQGSRVLYQSDLGILAVSLLKVLVAAQRCLVSLQVPVLILSR